MAHQSGLANGSNPMRKIAFKRGMVGSLLLMAGLAALMLSQTTKPECVRVPPECHDAPACPQWFQRNLQCHDRFPHVTVATACMQTCGCCTDPPADACPNKVPTLKSIIADSNEFLKNFIITFVTTIVLIYFRLCCCSPLNTEAKRAHCASLSMTLGFVLVLGCFWVAYHLYDCRNELLGISDVLFAASSCCFVCANFVIGAAVTQIPSIAQCDALLANIADKRRCADPDILVLDVSADRARRFLGEEQQHDTSLTVQTTRSCLGQFLRALLCLELLALSVFLALVFYFGVVKPDKPTRAASFFLGYFLMVFVMIIHARIRRSKTYLDYEKNQAGKQWLQELEGPQELLLFRNVSTPTPENPASVEYKSVISIGTYQACFFDPPAQVADGAAQPFLAEKTYTRILSAEGQAEDVIEFKTVAKAQNPGIGGRQLINVHAESVARFPLEPHHVAIVRAWMQERQSTFEFENAPEVEMTQPDNATV